MTEELMPCPFCGGKNILNGYRFIFCPDCRAMIDHLCNRENGITAWNRRAEPIGNADELPEWFVNHLKFNIEQNRNLLRTCKTLDTVLDNTREDALKNELRWMEHFLSLRKPEDP